MTFRPTSLDDFCGQERAKRLIKIALEASKIRKTPFPHTLLCGRPGLGKTSLAYVIVNELGESLSVFTVGNNIKDEEGLVDTLLKLCQDEHVYRPRVLIIDEVHSLNEYVEEKLYSVMEDFEINILNETYTVPPLTIIGTTTKLGMVSRPLRERFGLIIEMEDYTVEEIAEIAAIVIIRHGIIPTAEAAVQLALRARNTPRIAVKLAKLVVDFATVNGKKEIDEETVLQAMRLYGIDMYGLEERDYKFLEVLVRVEKPLGLTAIAVTLGEDRQTIEEVIEPYLLSLGAIRRTTRGREITDIGINILQSKEENFNGCPLGLCKKN